MFSFMQFDAEFTSEAPTDSLVEGSRLSESQQAAFQGFVSLRPDGMGSIQVTDLDVLLAYTRLMFNRPARSARV